MNTWPGKSVGVRAPEPNETPLSESEVMHGQNIHLIATDKDEVDTWPIERLRTPAWAWKLTITKKATPWDALVA